MSSEYDETAFEVRPVDDELIAMDLETSETHLLSAEAATAFREPGTDRRSPPKGGVLVGALVGAGAIQTILAPAAASACSAGKTATIAASVPSTCTTASAGNVEGTKIVMITITAFSVGTVTVTATGDNYNAKSGGMPLLTVTSDCATTRGNLVLGIKQPQNVTSSASQIGPPVKNASTAPIAPLAARSSLPRKSSTPAIRRSRGDGSGRA